MLIQESEELSDVFHAIWRETFALSVIATNSLSLQPLMTNVNSRSLFQQFQLFLDLG